MDDKTKRELVAAGKITIGGLRIASGIATGLGLGIIGSYLRRHNMKPAAAKLARASIEGGQKMMREGWKEFTPKIDEPSK